MARVSISRTLGVLGTFGTSAKCGLELLGLRPNVDRPESRNKSEFGGRVRLCKEPFARRLCAPSVKVCINIYSCAS